MTFHPGLVAADAAAGAGAVDYRLQRQRVVADVHAGIVDRSDACDIHPELLRAARNVAVPGPDECPICDATGLRTLSYVFGPRLGAGGKLVATLDEMQRLARRSGEFVCYEVECCVECGWNHLRRRFPLTG